MAEQDLKTFNCSVVFARLTGPASVKAEFNGLVGDAIADVPIANRIVIDTGNGLAITVLDKPEDALQIGLVLRNSLAALVASPVVRGAAEQFRIGINLGPVMLVTNINGQVNVVGDGINVAERIMSFAEPGQLLASQSFHDRVAQDTRVEFTSLGMRADNNQRTHAIFLAGKEQLVREPAISALPVHAPIVEGARLLRRDNAMVDFLNDHIKVGVTAAMLIFSATAMALMLANKNAARQSAPPPSMIVAAPANAPVNAPVSTLITEAPLKASTLAPVAQANQEPVPATQATESPIIPQPVATPTVAPAESPANVAAANKRANLEKSRTTVPQPTAKQAPRPSRSVATTGTTHTADAAKSTLPAPVPVLRVPTHFPPEAARENIRQGSVKARLLIDATGAVGQVDIIDARPSHVFDREVRRALSQWKFNAGADNRHYEIEIDFSN